jgi:pantoate--beta-alanine ligase
MQLVTSIGELKAIVGQAKNSGKVGFVPTMGALHQGHISLVKQCASENNFIVVSIYVNPTQFNDKADLQRYPRDINKDLELLRGSGCTVVFAPTDNEMYPKPDTRKFNFGTLETVMEGKFRPGHFNGVAQIVSKLFDAVQPDRAYFGLKDFQQLAIIKRMVKDYNYPVEIIPCSIVREPDGLAMSSRNMLLEPEKRSAAPHIYQTLKQILPLAKLQSPEKIKEFVSTQFKTNANLELEYFEIIDDETLQPISKFDNTTACSACIAVFAGKIRLIDNIQFYS